MIQDIINNRTWPATPATPEVVDAMMQKLANGFEEDYKAWKHNISQINDEMDKYVKNLGFISDTVPKFSYDEFCVIYMNKVKNWLAVTNLLDTDALELIVYDMIVEHVKIHSNNMKRIDQINYDDIIKKILKEPVRYTV